MRDVSRGKKRSKTGKTEETGRENMWKEHAETDL